MLSGVFFIAFLILVMVLADLNHQKPFYISKTGKPFIERDKDGYLTLESYQSHIKHWTNGRTEVDIWALTQTRTWKEDMEACKRLREHIEKKP